MPELDLDEQYLEWLYGQVAPVKARTRTRTYWSLFNHLYGTIFVAIVPHDENRIADGKDLRYEFLAEREDLQGDLEWMRSPCTMLELFIILARLLAFEMDDAPMVWFWHLMDTLGMKQFNDREYNEHPDHVEETVTHILDRVIWRNYRPDGRGGCFPLRDPDRDQRKVELWYQLNAYLLELF